MVKIVKYSKELAPDEQAACAEKLANCEKTATLHVCFEDGSGAYVCKRCFARRVDECTWITDDLKMMLAS
ncbi:MAG: hypothetical protein ACYCXE_04495 [Thermoleophilia bacterium]